MKCTETNARQVQNKLKLSSHCTDCSIYIIISVILNEVHVKSLPFQCKI
jgi:hypothetical protein